MLMLARTTFLRTRVGSAVVPSTPPTFVAAGAVASGTTSLSIAYYAGLAADDIALVFAHSFGATFTAPSGFTQITPVANGTWDGAVSWKRLVGSESGSVTYSTAGGANSRGVMIGIRGAIASGDPYEGYDTNVSDGSASSVSAAIITTVANTLAVRFCGESFSSDTSDPAPTGYTQRVNAAASSIGTCIDTKTLTASGTEPASSRLMDDAGSPWVVLTLAVLPA